jgi:hypothetical protein
MSSREPGSLLPFDFCSRQLSQSTPQSINRTPKSGQSTAFTQAGQGSFVLRGGMGAAVAHDPGAQLNKPTWDGPRSWVSRLRVVFERPTRRSRPTFARNTWARRRSSDSATFLRWSSYEARHTTHGEAFHFSPGRYVGDGEVPDSVWRWSCHMCRWRAICVGGLPSLAGYSSSVRALYDFSPFRNTFASAGHCGLAQAASASVLVLNMDGRWEL